MSSRCLQPHAWRRWFVIVVLVALPLILVGRALTLQVYEGAFFAGTG